MTKEKKFVRAKYDPITMRVNGYFPSDIQYPNNIINDAEKTIDSNPFVEISLEEHRNFIGKNVIVVDGILHEREEKETTEQKKSRIKLERTSSRKSFWESSRAEAIEYLLSLNKYPNKEKRERVKQEIDEIETATTLTALNKFSQDFE